MDLRDRRVLRKPQIPDSGIRQLLQGMGWSRLVFRKVQTPEHVRQWQTADAAKVPPTRGKAWRRPGEFRTGVGYPFWRSDGGYDRASRDIGRPRETTTNLG